MRVEQHVDVPRVLLVLPHRDVAVHELPSVRDARLFEVEEGVLPVRLRFVGACREGDRDVAVADDNTFYTAHKQQLLFKEIERLMKKFRTHRCALDFDQGFVKAELKEEE